ncbi:SCS3 Inositol phospholipid synthesis protein [Teratosphaeria destructans]|uniref:Acyl-coenzyme A diphosphatase SCS3 n=1 Tax=Teratosphaeria destructans TaxID=418781 RepID=A0A9W7W3Y6_9PEZI|nr:SCS3 Inositol phospholipid synthesis protein [Teratosphaeria destructans]
MATRRTKVEVPIPPPSNANSGATKPMQTSTTLDAAPAFNSPYLPTALETLGLAIYLLTLLLGSIFSLLHPSTRNGNYLPQAQSYDPANAPSYFAKKSNIFNVYFVKVGWFWITLAFFGLLISSPSLGPPLRPAFTRRRVQAVLRYAVVTLVWVFVTQWFFGPAIVDRSFRWTGGKCESVQSWDDVKDAEDMGEQFGKAVTHAACKTLGGQWKGGHDISGHVFLLILGSAMLWLELLPALLKVEGLREARRILTADGLVRSAAIEAENEEVQGDKIVSGRTEKKGPSIGIKAALFVAGLSWWMLLMTAAYFHTWFEKFTGLLVAFAAVYTVYFLPRAVPAWRSVIGMPGV